MMASKGGCSEGEVKMMDGGMGGFKGIRDGKGDSAVHEFIGHLVCY